MRITRMQTAVGERMRDAARSAGLSKAQIAARLQCSENAVYRYWRGERRPDEPTMDRYAALVGVSAEYLWNGLDPAGIDYVIEAVVGASPATLSNAAIMDQIEALLAEVRGRLAD